jgi:hypothetical protein
MFEFPALAVVSCVANAGLAPVMVTRTVAAEASAVRALISDGGGRPVAERLPVGRVRLVQSASAQRIVQARVPFEGCDLLWLTWILTPGRGTTEVDLAGQFECRGPMVRLALLLGGGRWLARRLDAILGQVATQALRTAEDLDDAPSIAACVRRAPAA